jgi:hypothetical protein
VDPRGNRSLPHASHSLGNLDGPRFDPDGHGADEPLADRRLHILILGPVDSHLDYVLLDPTNQILARADRAGQDAGSAAFCAFHGFL